MSGAVHWGWKLSSVLFHYPAVPWWRLVVGRDEVVLERPWPHDRIVIRPGEVDRLRLRYVRPFEACSVVVVQWEVLLFAPLRRKATGMELEAAGWPVEWELRTAGIRRRLPGLGFPADRPRWRPLGWVLARRAGRGRG